MRALSFVRSLFLSVLIDLFFSELARLEAEKAMLQQMKDEELRQLKLASQEQIKQREDALKREQEEREAQVIASLTSLLCALNTFFLCPVANDQRRIRCLEIG